MQAGPLRESLRLPRPRVMLPRRGADGLEGRSRGARLAFEVCLGLRGPKPDEGERESFECRESS